MVGLKDVEESTLEIVGLEWWRDGWLRDSLKNPYNLM